MNSDAGRGNLLFLMVRLDTGENLPFVLDTGAPITCLDASLEPKLGTRVRTDIMWEFGVKSHINIYAAPRFYLGKSLLAKTGPYIATHDWKPLASRLGYPIMGVIGMDILENYCVQLDFRAHKIRFLDDNAAQTNAWGKSFSLSDIGDGCFYLDDNLTGRKGPGSVIDTGYNSGGWLVPELFQLWTNQSAPIARGQAHYPDAVLGRNLYRGIDLQELDPGLRKSEDTHIRFNGIGIQFFARNLVTLDFPQQSLYLKPIAALAGSSLKTAADLEGKSALNFLRTLEQSGQLPGWSPNDEIANHRVVFHFDYPDKAVFDIPKNGVSFIYHYEVFRDSIKSPWKLKKAWQTDPAGKTVEIFPLP